eukprot:TRINITY_DN29851_c0_g1_i1.p1 TRINITY_DN29851_c0_g1~~TRINITY_DN29851_c0_g1_i1.p1  ORF type:complete len:613 (+),score=99.84 TRINITY_DN29851_c0_g1_i1:131-1840(+)
MDMLKAFDHPNITRLYDTHEDRDCFYMVLEYCDEADFGDKITERGTDISEAELSHWMRQALAAVAAVHAKQVAHRDIKPDNFMISRHCLKLADFGLAVYVPPGTLLKDKCGTPAFMAPEVHTMPKSRGYTLCVDDWAVGLMMFMLMTGGKHPFWNKKQLDLRKLLTGKLVWPMGGFFGCAKKHQYSPRAQEFCQKLATADPRKRMTCKQALDDPLMAEPSTSPITPVGAGGRELLSSSLAPSSQRFQWMFERRQLMPGVPLPMGMGFEKLARINMYNWSKWLTAEELQEDLSKFIRNRRDIRVHAEGSRSSGVFKSPKDAIQWLKAGCPARENPQQPRPPTRCEEVESPLAQRRFEDVEDDHEQPASADVEEGVQLAMPAVTAAMAAMASQANSQQIDEDRMWSLTESVRTNETRIPANLRVAESHACPNLSPLQRGRGTFGGTSHCWGGPCTSQEPMAAFSLPPPPPPRPVAPAAAAAVAGFQYAAPVWMAAFPPPAAPPAPPARATPAGLAGAGVRQQGASLPAAGYSSAPGVGVHGGFVGHAMIAPLARQNHPQAAYQLAAQIPRH